VEVPGTPQKWDKLPNYSHAIPIRIPKDMGMVWVPLTIRGSHFWVRGMTLDIKNGGQDLRGLTQEKRIPLSTPGLPLAMSQVPQLSWNNWRWQAPAPGAEKNSPKKRGEKTESVAIWWTNIWFLCQKTAYFFSFDFVRIVNNKILTQIRFGCQTVCIFLLNWGVIEGWEFPRNFVVWDWGLHMSIFWERNGNQGDTNHSSYSPLKV